MTDQGAAVTGTTEDGWSVYDAAVPHVSDLPEVAARAEELRSLRQPPGWSSLAEVEDVVVVVSSSRGGSSLFGELLRRTPGLLHLRAEINPLFALAGLSKGPERRRVLEAELLADIGRPGDRIEGDEDRVVADLAWRLLVQWPVLAAPPVGGLLDVVRRCVRSTRSLESALLASLDQVRPRLRPDARWYYDAAEVHATPGCPRPAGPPSDAFVEMPPFVTTGAWAHASAEDVRRQPLVLTTPRSSFRLAFLQDLFPASRLRVIHLTRNPGAVVNGLVDGWRHRGFFNTPVPGGLRIPGYSDVVPGGDRWWCYDLPPGWDAWTDRPLPEVAAFQWRATHQAVLDSVAELDLERHVVPFESVVGPPAEREPLLAELASWLGINGEALSDVTGSELPVVMATAPPQPGRWRARTDELGPALLAPDVQEMAAQLGYADPRSWR